MFVVVLTLFLIVKRRGNLLGHLTHSEIRIDINYNRSLFIRLVEKGFQLLLLTRQIY